MQTGVYRIRTSLSAWLEYMKGLDGMSQSQETYTLNVFFMINNILIKSLTCVLTLVSNDTSYTLGYSSTLNILRRNINHQQCILCFPMQWIVQPHMAMAHIKGFMKYHFSFFFPLQAAKALLCTANFAISRGLFCTYFYIRFI